MVKPYVYVDRQLPADIEAYLAEHVRIGKWEGAQPMPRARLLEELTEAEGLITSSTAIDDELLERAPRLRVVSSISVGYNHFDLSAMKARGVLGTNTPDVLNETVADLVFALMLGAARRVAELDAYIKQGKWRSGDGEALFGVDVHHRTLGIIGMGRIGEAIARRAKLGFGMDVLYCNRSRKPDAEERLGVQYRTMDELLAAADFVVLMLPLTPDTEGIIGREQFALMKPDAIFINASRGRTVDEEALVEALREGRIRGAGLDVFRQEPVETDHPLLRFPNVVALPHIGSATAQTRFDMAMLAARNLVSALSGDTPPNLVPELR